MRQFVETDFDKVYDELSTMNRSDDAKYKLLGTFRGYHPDGTLILPTDVNPETNKPYKTLADYLDKEHFATIDTFNDLLMKSVTSGTFYRNGKQLKWPTLIFDNANKTPNTIYKNCSARTGNNTFKSVEDYFNYSKNNVGSRTQALGNFVVYNQINSSMFADPINKTGVNWEKLKLLNSNKDNEIIFNSISDIYDYKFVPPGSELRLLWDCNKNKHEPFVRKVEDMTRISGLCPICSLHKAGSSFSEFAIFKVLKEVMTADVEWHNRSALNNRELDIYIPSLNTAIEYDGLLYHLETGRKDNVKDEMCINSGINLIRLREIGLKDSDVCLYRKEPEYQNIPESNIIWNIEPDKIKYAKGLLDIIDKINNTANLNIDMNKVKQLVTPKWISIIRNDYKN